MSTIARKMVITLVAASLVGFGWQVAAVFGETISMPPLSELSHDCTPGFHLVAMPSRWQVSTQSENSLPIITHVAIDFGMAPEESYRVVAHDRDGQPVYELSDYPFMVLEVQIRAHGERSSLQVLEAVHREEHYKSPVVLSWDLRDSGRRLVPPGSYEIEVRGRLVPEDSKLTAEDSVSYHDFDNWSSVIEFCTRVITIEVVDEVLPPRVDRGTSCDPPPPTYYDGVDDTSASALRATLHPIIDDHTRYTYSSTSSTDTWDVLNDADENPANVNQLLTIYKNEAYADGCTSGCTWNREHTWAKSYGFSEETGNGRIPYTDCHHLRAANSSYNTSRGNRPFNDCVSGCISKPVDVNAGFGGNDPNYASGDNTISCPGTPANIDRWEVWDHRKGDVARSMMYMDLRYEGDSGAMGDEQDLILTDNLALMTIDTDNCSGGYQDPGYLGLRSTLVAWALADPPDADEIRRNNQVWCYQANRNPFVDHPEWVNCMYNGICSGGGPAFGGISSATDEAACLATGVLIEWPQPSDWNDDCSSGCNRGFRVYREATEITSGGCRSSQLGEASTSCLDDSGATGVLYTYRVEAFNHDGNFADGGATADAGDFTDDGTGPTISDGPSAIAESGSFSVSWSTNEPADSELRWGRVMGGPYPGSVTDPADVIDHALVAESLLPSKTYYYRVCSTDACDNGPTCSAEQSVNTIGGCDPGSDTGVFINELHYDNDGTDSNEFIEIAGPSGTDLGDGPWTLELYNGNGGALYNTVSLSGTIDDEGNGYGAVAVNFPTNGIQNGPSDSIALIDGAGEVVQFLCYEGVMTAVGGTLDGQQCTDIGVSETDATDIGNSLQLVGGPDFVYEGFSWTGPADESPGVLNNGQTMECTATPSIFSDDFEGGNLNAWSHLSP